MDPFLGKRLSQVTKTDLARLVDGGVMESRYFEFKKLLSLKADDEKQEFLRDITAFANAEGGLIIYGVEEDRVTGAAKALVGFSVPNKDALRRQIEELLSSGVDERLPRSEIEFVEMDNASSMLLIRVEKSNRAPHMLARQHERRFFIRTNSGKEQMSTSQIRDAVLRTDAVNERIQRFVNERVEKWKRQGVATAYWLMHVMPLSRDPAAIDVTDEAMTRRLQKMKWPIASDYVGHCLDGYKVSQQLPNGGLTQRIIFRDGCVELIDNYAFDHGNKTLSCVEFDRIIRETLDSVLELYRDGTVQPPLAVCMALVGVQGYTMPMKWRNRIAGTPIDEDRVVIDPIVLTDLPEDESKARESISLAIDTVWNAFGYPKVLGFGW